MMSHNHKRKFYLATAMVILFLLPSAYAFRNMMNGKRFLSMWTWLGGANAPNATGNYGNQGSSAPTPPTPGSRMNSCSWTDSAGNKWFFGGYTIMGTNSYNDLWKYDPVANEWTWMAGSSLPNSSASYGVQGVPAATNYPGARQGCVSWTDASNNLWLLGGYNGTSYYNDLWKYNLSTNQWTWITGSSSANQPGTYGTQGVAAAANTPGGRGNGQGWKDAAGNFYLFGGLGPSNAYYNDLWKFNTSTNQWAWISGSNIGGVVNGLYGTKGSSAPVPPLPGARSSATSCTDATTGNQWFFGGINSGYYYNDLWKYNPSSDQWTWMAGSGLSGTGVGVHGTKGVAAASNFPGYRTSASCWTDQSGNFWLFGGLIAGSPQMNDLWKFDVSTNLWTWMAGSSSINQPATYGTQGVAAAANTPGCRYSSATWTDGSGDLWLFGGFNLNDLWKFNISSNQWMWVSGTPSNTATTSVYGTQGSSALAPPALGSRYSAVTWADSSGEQWFFGGYANGYWNDLWKYNLSTNQWTWVNGPTTAGGAASYGTKGTPAVSNIPGARQGSATWSDSSGNLWLFGGLTGSYMNDLWKYDRTTNQWTWMTGSNTGGATGVYGTQGVASSTTTPGARTAAIGWTDASGNFWLFGGTNGSNYFNDLWKYDPSANQWTWMTGSSSTGAAGYYGTKGTPTVSTTPGARAGVAGAKDVSGTMWLFGGYSPSNYNDLWKFDTTTNQWTWVSGPSTANQGATYGTQGVAAGANIPGSRAVSSMSIDSNNLIWLFGGSNGGSRYNDLWKYDIGTNQWTWMLGSNGINQIGTYGTQGVAGVSNTPGARNNMVTWIDAANKLWLFGGTGHTNSATWGNLSDLWKYDSTSNQWTWISGGNILDVVNINGTKGSTTGVPPYPGSRYQTAFWKDSSGNFWLFGGTGYSSTNASGNLNDLWKYDPTSGEWAWMSGGISISAYGTYGTKGVAAAANTPGARTGSAGFLDSNGKFWIFGGNGYGGSGASGYLNDLWKFDSTSNQWTWTAGVSSTNALGIYGTQGVGSAANSPGARNLSARWSDGSGNLWLLGGNGYPISGGLGALNDLWKFNPTAGEWTWVSGSSSIGANSVFGTKGSAAGVSPFPGSRYFSTSWTDANGIFWLHGGYGYGEFETATIGNLNDLWKYDPVAAQWTWMSGSNTITQAGVYGTQGTPAASNVPGARQSAVGWADASNNLYLFGGNNGSRLNDLWKYDQSTNQWTWMTGSNTGNQLGVYGTQGVAAASNTPGSRYSSVTWSASANYFWIFGGYDNAGNSSDLWKYDPGTNQWTWVSGPNTVNGVGAYGTQGSTALVPPMPMARSNAASWKDASGNFWLFGGTNLLGNFNDLWKYNPTSDQWTWISGSSGPTNYGVYGTKGVTAPTNMPGSRYSPLTWVDASGNFWLLGGYGQSTASTGYLNDLWKYDPATNQWTWMTGSAGQNVVGTYGTQGVASSTTTPGSRSSSVGFKDASGNLFVFGGNGYSSGPSGFLNDLWKYDISTNQWTWTAGASGTSQAGNYGTQGVTTPTNYPGSRYSSVGLTDSSGNFWLFGGNGHAAIVSSGYLYDLWKYNPATNQWTWMKGPNTTSNYGTYGALRREGATFQPGGRERATGWIDADNNIWIFGGWGYGAASFQNLAELWKYNPTTNQWAWMSGSNVTNTNGVYGTLQTPSVLNAPGSRVTAVGWYGSDGNLWLFGGSGYSGTGATGNLNDFWKYRLK